MCLETPAVNCFALATGLGSTLFDWPRIDREVPPQAENSCQDIELDSLVIFCLFISTSYGTSEIIIW